MFLGPFIRFLIIGIVGLFAVQSRLLPVRLQLTNDCADILVSKKVCIRIVLEEHEQGLYKDMLRFSVDVPSLLLVGWHVVQIPSLQYVLSFKRAKKIYNESCNAEFFIDFSKNISTEQRIKILSSASFYVSGMILQKDGTNKTFDLSIPLDQQGLSLTQTTTGVNVPSGFETLVTGTHSNVFVPETHQKLESFDVENRSVDRVLTVWRKIVTGLRSLYESEGFILWYLVFLSLCLLLILKKYVRVMRFFIPLWGYPEQELRRLLIWICLGATIVMFRTKCKESHILLALAIFFVFPALDYICASQETFWGRFKSLLGFVLAMSIIPLIVKALILMYLTIK